MERSERFSIALACGLGALIGSSVMLEVAGNPFLTTLGALCGGVLGYVLYRPRDVLNAIRDAAREALQTVELEHLSSGVKTGIRVVLPVGLYLIMLTMGIWMSLSLWDIKALSVFTDGPLAPVVIVLYEAQTVFCIAFIFLATIGLFLDEEDEDDVLPSPILLLCISVLLPSPLGTLAIVLIAIMFFSFMVWKFFITIPQIIRIIRHFSWTVFVRIHSDRRLMCLTDAATGSLIGYCAGSAIIGCISGALIGLLNYEVISKYLLKLVPLSSHS